MSGHGTRACYLRGCDRPECARAARRYCKEYRMRILADPTCTGVPAGPAAEHTAQLHARGMSYAAIAAAAGVSESTVKRLARQRKTSRATAAAILAVTVHTPADTHWVPALGSARRIQALHTLGYSYQYLAPLVGLTSQNLRFLTIGEHRRVASDTAARIAAAYDLLCMTPRAAATRYEQGAASRSRATAARNGWVPPLAWDDIDTDPAPAPDSDTSPELDRVVLDRVLTGTTVNVPIHDRPPIVRELASRGMSDGEIARRLGVWTETVLRIRHRHGIPAAVPVDGVGLNGHNQRRAAA